MKNGRHLQCAALVLASTAGALFSQTAYSQTADKKVRLIISFISFSSGIDGKSKGEVDRFITKYEKDNDLILKKEVVHWGMEGEMDYCFMLSELSATSQTKFVSSIKSLARKLNQTHVSENAPCKKAKWPPRVYRKSP